MERRAAVAVVPGADGPGPMADVFVALRPAWPRSWRPRPGATASVCMAPRSSLNWLPWAVPCKDRGRCCVDANGTMTRAQPVKALPTCGPNAG